MIFNKRFVIGQELVRRNLISQDQLDEALVYQAQKGVRLGRALVNLGYIKEADLLVVLADQLGLPCIDFATIEIPQEALDQVSYAFAIRHTVIPIAFDDDGLLVCLPDPLNERVVDKLRTDIAHTINLAVASEEDICVAIEKYYKK